MKKCIKCGIEKTLLEFQKDRRNPDGRGAKCSVCYNERRKFLRQNNPEPYKKEYRRQNLKRHKWTPELFDTAFSEQKGKCKICGKYMLEPNADHDHKSNKPRGLLCGGCNVFIGFLERRAPLLQKALGYLNEYSAPS